MGTPGSSLSRPGTQALEQQAAQHQQQQDAQHHQHQQQQTAWSPQRQPSCAQPSSEQPQQTSEQQPKQETTHVLRLLKQLAQQEEDELEDALPRVPPLPPQKRGLPWAALYNFYHSTCYLNAGLQSFAHNPVLNCALDSLPPTKEGKPRCICLLLREELSLMRFNPTCVVTPSSFYYNTVLPLGFEEHRQEDAHELQNKLITKMMECEHQQIHHPSNHQVKTTKVGMVFDGFTCTQMTCQDCRHSSELRVDPIGQLNLPIDGCSNVKESLHAFFAPETIEGYRCEGCGKQACATKTEKVYSQPPALQVTLKRFKKQLNGTCVKDKRDITLVEFLHIPTNFLQQQHVNDAAPAAAKAAAASSSQAPYRLSGVTVHHGDTPRSGHYVHYFRVDEQWFVANDDRTWQISHEEVMQLKNAYLLNYNQQQTPLIHKQLMASAKSWVEDSSSAAEGAAAAAGPSGLAPAGAGAAAAAAAAAASGPAAARGNASSRPASAGAAAAAAASGLGAARGDASSGPAGADAAALFDIEGQQHFEWASDDGADSCEDSFDSLSEEQQLQHALNLSAAQAGAQAAAKTAAAAAAAAAAGVECQQQQVSAGAADVQQQDERDVCRQQQGGGVWNGGVQQHEEEPDLEMQRGLLASYETAGVGADVEMQQEGRGSLGVAGNAAAANAATAAEHDLKKKKRNKPGKAERNRTRAAAAAATAAAATANGPAAAAAAATTSDPEPPQQQQQQPAQEGRPRRAAAAAAANTWRHSDVADVTEESSGSEQADDASSDYSAPTPNKKRHAPVASSSRSNSRSTQTTRGGAPVASSRSG